MPALPRLLLLAALSWGASAHCQGVRQGVQIILQSDIPDTGKVNHLNHFFDTSIHSTSPDSLLVIAQAADQLADKIHYRQGKAIAVDNIGLAYDDMGEYDKAIAKYQESLSLLEPNTIQGRVTLELAQLYKDMTGFDQTGVYIDKAIAYSREAYDLYAEKKDTNGMASSLNQLGITARDKAHKYPAYYDTALTAYLQAAHLLELEGKVKKSIRTKLYNNISQVYIEYKHDYRTALGYLFKAVADNEDLHSLIGLTYNYGNIANAYGSMDVFDSSLLYAKKMVDVAGQLGQPERLVNAYFDLYFAYKIYGRSDSALKYYILSTDINDSLTNVKKADQVSELETKYQTQKKEDQIGLLQMRGRWLMGAAVFLAGLAAWMIWSYRRVKRQKGLIAEQSARLEMMMKELHHRVKNNLQVVSSLLSLQSYELMDEGAVSALKESQQRVQAMSLIHQRLYKKDSLTSVNMKEYLTDLAESLLASYGFDRDGFDLQVIVGSEMLDVDKALPLGLIINEMVTNALKYAYPSVSRPSLLIMLTENTRHLVCQVKDNGIGLDEQRWREKSQSFGKQLISALCRQLRAQQSLVVDGGTEFTLTIPKQVA